MKIATHCNLLILRAGACFSRRGSHLIYKESMETHNKRRRMIIIIIRGRRRTRGRPLWGLPTRTNPRTRTRTTAIVTNTSILLILQSLLILQENGCLQVVPGSHTRDFEHLPGSGLHAQGEWATPGDASLKSLGDVCSWGGKLSDVDFWGHWTYCRK